MGEEGDEPTVPRAVIHRNILDVAESRPNASLQAIAREVSGASVDLVDRVLAEYGDPHGGGPDESDATDESDASEAATATGESAATDESEPSGTVGRDTPSAADDRPAPEGENAPPDREDDPSSAGESTSAEAGGPAGETEASPPELTAKQRRTLGVVAENPTASQSEVAQQLDVTAATVSRRLNAIPGFDWQRRAAFARRVLGPDDTGEASGRAGGASGRTDDSTAAETSAVADPADEPTASDQADAADRDADAASAAAGDASSQPATAGRSAEAAREAVRPDGAAGTGQSSGDPDPEALSTALDRLHRSVSDLERRLEDVDCPDASTSLDPELVHKVMHACIESDDVSTREEVVVLRRLLGEE